ncbi:Hypothetical predicted protein [Lecanosticta acicola]|uniref:Yeast cell wall synthesis Kre9/Knh1-like N-terminal domain-containing protein n=1 Tax=Lecanosticta acicola TaxID=111012 RepID=A0AAI9ECZ2_9PEZI|nr:Hypothetical predicted protein [Lecanosticta acicola]
MLFPRSFIVALLSAPLLALAQKPNPFNVAASGLSASAGQDLKLTWSPTTQGTVSLILRSGGSDDLKAGTTIAKSIENSGSYTWSVPDDAIRGSDYTIEIVSDSNPSETNYTPYFVLESSHTGTTSLGSATLGAPTTSLSLSTASPTVETTSATKSASSAKTTGTASTSSSSSASETGSTTTATSAATSGSNEALSTGTASSTVSQAGAARATQIAGLLGAVALGALAL